MHEILVDEKGYKQYFEELEKLKQLSLFNSSAGSQAFNCSHPNSAALGE